MTGRQRKWIQARYDSLQTIYDSLNTVYRSNNKTMTTEMHSLYGQMQKMHRQMKSSHRSMMKEMRGRHMQGKGMMKGKGMGGKGMRDAMRDQISMEWYQQMLSMHERMARMHRKRGQETMARMNRRLSRQFRGMMKQMRRSTESDRKDAGNRKLIDPAALNGANLFSRHCSSCHGNQGKGTTGVFPPVVNTEWITAEKSIPIRIVLHGLSGVIEVDNRTYRGFMPAFGARLSNAETAAILNHLRSLSDQNIPKITPSDIQEIRQKYSGRKQPWSTDELK